MRSLRFFFALLLLAPLPASGQQYLCRTSPVGASTAYCGSEAFVTDSVNGPLAKGPFSGVAACTSALEGTRTAVTDSTTGTWGAVITGSGSNHVLAYCDGTNWTVAGK